MKYGVLIAVLALAVSGQAQVSQDEAGARLRARDAARATQPSTQIADEVARLRRMIDSLQQQVAALKEENRSLRERVAKGGTPKVSPGGKPAAVDPDEDGPGLYQMVYYMRDGSENTYEVPANGREAALKIAAGQGVKLKVRTDLDGNDHPVIKKLRELTPQERAQ